VCVSNDCAINTTTYLTVVDLRSAGYPCKHCRKVCKSAGGLGTHKKYKHGLSPSKPKKNKKPRHQYDYNKKLKTLDDEENFFRAGHSNYTALAAGENGIHSKKAITKWRAQMLFIVMAIFAGAGKEIRFHSPDRVLRTARDPDLEDELFATFICRREVRNLKVSGRWLKKEFRRLVLERKPDGWEGYKYSNRWLHRFQNRYNITNQVRSNKKHLSVLERLPHIQRFHRFLQKLRCNGPQRDVKYGRFPAKAYFHMDQIPLPFSLDCNRSLGRKGVACRIFQPGGGLDKRQATLQLCIRAEGEQIAKPALIFRGKGLRITEVERMFYASIADDVRIHFQPKAWADTEVCMDWLEDFASDTADLRADPNVEEVLLGMDNHGSQQVLTFKQRMAALSIIPAYTPPDCTDVVAPVDHHVGAHIKVVLAKFFHAEIEAHQEEWEDGNLSASCRRMLMAHWVVLAWRKIKQKKHLMRQSFVSTGFLIAKDGSEDHKIKMSGLPEGFEYTY
jgi:hypothetical protein